MSSGPVFPQHSVSIDPEQLCGDTTANVVTTDWYPTSQYAYSDSFTPYQPGIESGQHSSWSNGTYTRSSTADLTTTPYAVQPHHMQHSTHAPSSHQPSPQQQHQQTPQVHDYSRPRSSPSTFGPSDVPWMNGNGLGIHMTTAPGQTTAAPAYPPGVFQNNPLDFGDYSTTNRPEILQPRPRTYASIAPNLNGPAAKRKRDEEDQQPPSHDGSAGSGVQSKTKRKRTSSVVSADLSEEDRFLVQLKQEENLPWKDIATRFQTEKGRSMQVAALQMRYKRLREKFRTWEEVDVHALRLAHEYWEKYKWEIISSKMLDFSIQERWPARHCSRKWQELEAASATHVPNAVPNPGHTPVSLPQFSSPIDTGGHMQFAFKPLQ